MDKYLTTTQNACRLKELTYLPLLINLGKVLRLDGFRGLCEIELEEETDKDTYNFHDDIIRECFTIDEGEHNYKCICGKKHLIYLNLFSHDRVKKKIIIGSKCIRKVYEYKDFLNENPKFKAKLETWIHKINEYYFEKHYKKCKCCKIPRINKKYEYKQDNKKFFCKDCSRKHLGELQNKCKDCGCWRKFKLKKNGKPKLRCKKCAEITKIAKTTNDNMS